MSHATRREFLGNMIEGTGLAGAGASLLAGTARAGSPADKVVLALIGAGGRGTHVIQGLSRLANVEIRRTTN